MTIVNSRRSTMTLYSGSTDPYSHRVRIVLAEKGVTFDFNEVDMNNPPEELVEVNPYCTVPTLVDRDLVLYKSEIIMEYLDERFPHPPLMPVYPVSRGRSRLLLYRVNRDWYAPLNKLMSEEVSETLKSDLRKELLSSILSVGPIFSEMPYFMSEEFSLVDCCVAPLLWRLPSVGVNIPKEATAIYEYMERLFARESFKASLTNAELALEG